MKKRNYVIKAVVFVLTLTLFLTGIPLKVQGAAAKPVIGSSQATIKKNSCTVTAGKKLKLTAKSGKSNITKKGTWKSSKKNVAVISKSGVLTAKGAGTAYITISYKGQTSKKLKVVVKEAQVVSKPEAGYYRLTYDINTKEKFASLSGDRTQDVRGEILQFAATVKTDLRSGKTFLGWYTKKTGGRQVLETEVPTANMTLYAHYTEKITRPVTFRLGCNYGGTYSFLGSGDWFDWKTQSYERGPMQEHDKDNVTWKHSYPVSKNNTYTIDSLPQPSVPGYRFLGWYTEKNFAAKSKVEPGQSLSTKVDTLYACFSKKLTISFDDKFGGKYEDIVVDTCRSIAECGQELPEVRRPGLVFKGWNLSVDESGTKQPLTADSVFKNTIAWSGMVCLTCDKAFKQQLDFYFHKKTCDNNGEHDWFMIYDEPDHITLYPIYERRNDLTLDFDPNGGYFSAYNKENYELLIYREDVGECKAGHGYKNNKTSGLFYGSGSTYPAVEGEKYPDGWAHNGGAYTMPKPSRSNYKFGGWIMPDGSEFTFDTILTESMTLTAKWLPWKCSVLFLPQDEHYDGTFTKEERAACGLDNSNRYSVTTETSLSQAGYRLPIPTHPDKRTFLGWFYNDGRKFEVTDQVMSDIVVYARWSTP